MEQNHSGLAAYLKMLPNIYVSYLWKTQCRTMKMR